MEKEINDDIFKRYSRQILFSPIGRDGQELLLKSRVAVIGMGALGTVSASCLARAGVGHLKLIDRDFVEESNLQRQILFDEDDARKCLPKVVAAENKLKKINSRVSYEAIFDDLNHINITGILDNVDLVLDATDNMETRLLINEACVMNKIPWIHGACVSSFGITFNIIPGETACLVCFRGEVPPAGTGETCETAGIISPVVNVVASVQSAEALKILTGNKESVYRQAMFFDLWSNTFSEILLVRNEECVVCGKGEYRLIKGEMQQRTSFLCGRETIQIIPPFRQDISLDELQYKLQPLGSIKKNKYLLKFFVDDYELTVFPDGRDFIKGTKDKKTARALYAKYIGA